jgi:hypothetical protein
MVASMAGILSHKNPGTLKNTGDDARLNDCYRFRTSMGAIMRKNICKALVFTCVLWTIAIFGSVDAHALAYKDISGNWCTGGGIEQFAPKTLTAIRSSDGVRTVFKIVNYEFTTTVRVYWMTKKNEKVSTDFSEFGADGRTMVQLKNEEGPRREFHRC